MFTKAIPAGTEILYDGRRGAFLRSGFDIVGGLRGNGLAVVARLKDGQLQLDWSPEPVACYRGAQLLGVWEPDRRVFREAAVKGTSFPPGIDLSGHGFSPIALHEKPPDVDGLLDVAVTSRKERLAEPSTPKAERPVRIWTDRTGKHQITAEFAGFAFGKVRLTKRNGESIQVDLDQLSAKDQAWVQSRR